MMSVEAIRQKIIAGLLPCDPCRVLWAGAGTRSTCAACDRPVAPEDIEYEREQRDGSIIRFHFRCYVLWDQYRREFQSQNPT